MVGQVIRKSTREKKHVDYLVNKKTADWKPSTGMTVQRVNSDSRSAENQKAAAHFEEETAKREGHPDNPKVKKALKDVLKELEENRD